MACAAPSSLDRDDRARAGPSATRRRARRWHAASPGASPRGRPASHTAPASCTSRSPISRTLTTLRLLRRRRSGPWTTDRAHGGTATELSAVGASTGLRAGVCAPWARCCATAGSVDAARRRPATRLSSAAGGAGAPRGAPTSPSGPN